MNADLCSARAGQRPEGCTSAQLLINYPQSKSCCFTRTSRHHRRTRLSLIWTQCFHFLLLRNKAAASQRAKPPPIWFNYQTKRVKFSWLISIYWLFCVVYIPSAVRSGKCRSALSWYVWAKCCVFAAQGYLQGNKEVQSHDCSTSFPHPVLCSLLFHQCSSPRITVWAKSLQSSYPNRGLVQFDCCKYVRLWLQIGLNNSLVVSVSCPTDGWEAVNGHVVSTCDHWSCGHLSRISHGSTGVSLLVILSACCRLFISAVMWWSRWPAYSWLTSLLLLWFGSFFTNVIICLSLCSDAAKLFLHFCSRDCVFSPLWVFLASLFSPFWPFQVVSVDLLCFRSFWLFFLVLMVYFQSFLCILGYFIWDSEIELTFGKQVENLSYFQNKNAILF